VYRLSEHRKPARFPVFVRSETDHFGPESELLASQDQLDAAVDALRARGQVPDGPLGGGVRGRGVADGLFRKYGAFFVDGAVIRATSCSRAAGS
jgi:hypothetical protein